MFDAEPARDREKDEGKLRTRRQGKIQQDDLSAGYKCPLGRAIRKVPSFRVDALAAIGVWEG